MEKIKHWWDRLSNDDRLSLAIASIFFALILLTALVRYQLDSTRNIFSIGDVLIATVPILIWLILSRRVTSFGVGPSGITVERALEKAFTAEATTLAMPGTSPEAAPAEWQTVDAEDKGPLSDLSAIAERRMEALRFRMGTEQQRNRYREEIISSYLSVLGADRWFRYLIIERADLRLFAVADARRVIAAIASQGFHLKSFAAAVNRGDEETLRRMPLLTLAETASLRLGASRGEALRSLEEQQAEWLPVVDYAGRFAGIVTRSQIMAAMLLQISEAVGSQQRNA